MDQGVRLFLAKHLGRDVAALRVLPVETPRDPTGAWEARIRRALRRTGAPARDLAEPEPVLVCDLRTRSALVLQVPDGAPVRVWGAAAGARAPGQPRLAAAPAPDALVEQLCARFAAMSLAEGAWADAPMAAAPAPEPLEEGEEERGSPRLGDFAGPVAKALAAAGLGMAAVERLVLLNVDQVADRAAPITDVGVRLEPVAFRLSRAGQRLVDAFGVGADGLRVEELGPLPGARLALPPSLPAADWARSAEPEPEPAPLRSPRKRSAGAARFEDVEKRGRGGRRKRADDDDGGDDDDDDEVEVEDDDDDDDEPRRPRKRSTPRPRPTTRARTHTAAQLDLSRAKRPRWMGPLTFAAEVLRAPILELPPLAKRDIAAVEKPEHAPMRRARVC